MLDAMNRRDFMGVAASAAMLGAASQGVRIGCQTRSYFAPVKDRSRLLRALDDIAAAGFAGFETNQLCLADAFANPGPMKEEMARRKLELFGLHLGGRLHETAGAAKAREDTLRVAKGIRALGGGALVFSPAAVNGLTGAELQAAFHRKADELTALGRICNGEGVRLCVHNHNEETLRGWAEFRVTGDKTRPREVWFLVDLGPSALTGQDPVSFLTDYHSRIAGLHVRDYQGEKQVRLGAGSVNLKGAAEALNRLRWSGWVLVEQEAGTIPGLTTEQASRQALKYIREEMKFG